MRFEGARLSLRLHRFELIAFGAALGGLVLVTFVAAAYVTSLMPGPECLQSPDLIPQDCQRAQQAFSSAQQALGGLLMAPLLLVTYAIGLFLGVPIVARELERGTARIAWWLAPSRWRWYVARVVPVLVVLIVLTYGAGLASDRFFAVSLSGVDPTRSFEGYGARGGLLASRAVFIFGISVAVGSILGRALPSVIISALVVTIGLWGGTQVHQAILKLEAVAIPLDMNDEFGGYRPGDMYLDQRFVLPDGTLVDYGYFGNEGPAYDEFGNSTYPTVNLVIPGERYRFVEGREALALGGASLVALLLGAGVVARRRPG
jgi:hypothetical protein